MRSASTPENVRILSPYVGGGFGSKLGIAPEAVAAAIAARELGRPVRVVMTPPAGLRDDRCAGPRRASASGSPPMPTDG